MGTTDNKINNGDPDVKKKQHKKISPEYDRHKPPEDGEDTDSFEFAVRSAKEDMNVEIIRMATYSLPTEIKYTLYLLRDRHENLGTEAKVAQYLAQTGIRQLEKIPEIQRLREKGKEIGKGRSEAAKIAHLDGGFRFNKELVGIKTYRFMIPMDKKVFARISNVSSDAGLFQSQGVTLTLIFGMAQSVEWLEEYKGSVEYTDYKKIAQDQVEEFKRWVKDRLKS